MTLEQLTIKGVGEYTGLNRESVEEYFKATNNVLPLLRDAVISPFEKALKEATGYNTENMPEGVAETVKKFD